MTPEEALDRGLTELALPLPQDARRALSAYVALLAKWNRVHNLTAIHEPLEMMKQHVLDSLAVLPHLPLSGEASVADIGSGGGLPGIPLALARPQWLVTLNEAAQKKAAFLRQAKIELQLKNLEVHEGRVEHWHPAAPFDLAISRAFADLDRFIGACRHLVAPGGWIAAMKGPREASREGCSSVALRVPFLDAERHLLLCKVA
ncbi:MAG TPA: 16S rRNA (guanine(527)-N(7))-methyltransferase RsmG [Burkholderiales bacterium]|nr:16S rRNA (guanine(527)-N(7))-methyltransferase RsmG [Burkholderiales bacterium]